MHKKLMHTHIYTHTQTHTHAHRFLYYEEMLSVLNAKKSSARIAGFVGGGALSPSVQFSIHPVMVFSGPHGERVNFNPPPSNAIVDEIIKILQCSTYFTLSLLVKLFIVKLYMSREITIVMSTKMNDL